MEKPGRLRFDSGHHRRILLTAVLLGIAAFVPVVARLAGLMLKDYAHYSALALKNQSRTTNVSGERGSIYDRSMNVLAQSVGAEHVYFNPRELRMAGVDTQVLCRDLAELLGKEAEKLLPVTKDYTKRYTQAARAVDGQTARKLRQYLTENGIQGVHLEPASVREYPFGTLAAQVIGFVNASGQGCEGIEAAWNDFLEGPGAKVVTTKGNHEIDMPYSYERFISQGKGCSVVLTLDAGAQQILERQLTQAISRYDVQNGAFGLVMNCKTGEILAMATLGSYDPNQYSEIYDDALRERLESGGATPEEYQAARLKQWRNRVISDGYEPGSTFKALTLAAALDTGAVNLNTDFYCRGAEQIPGRAQKLHCWKAAGHGAEKTPQALQNSCNIAFAHIALKLGGESFYDYIRRFGILEKTGIDLLGESKGIFFEKSRIVNTDKWGTASLTSGSFGQTFKITPLQLVRGIGAVVNGGQLLEPYLVAQVVDGEGNTVYSREPKVTRQVLKPETSAAMRDLLESVVTEGTAKNGAVAGYRVGGKTGTSEKIDVFDENGQRVLDKIVSFVGIAPMEDPQYIVLAALDTPSRNTGIYISGGVMAAPTVGAILGELLPYFGVE